MADEISLAAGMAVTKNGMTIRRDVTKTQTIYESLDSLHQTRQDVGSGGLEAVSLGDIDKTKEHLVMLVNVGSVPIKIDPGVGSGYWFIMHTGEAFGPVRIGASKDAVNPLQVQAVGSAGTIDVTACEAGDPTATP